MNSKPRMDKEFFITSFLSRDSQVYDNFSWLVAHASRFFVSKVGKIRLKENLSRFFRPREQIKLVEEKLFVRAGYYESCSQLLYLTNDLVRRTQLINTLKPIKQCGPNIPPSKHTGSTLRACFVTTGLQI